MAQGEQNKTEAADESTSAGRLAAKRAAKAAAKAAKRATGPVPNEVVKGVNAARSFYDNNVRIVWLGLGAGVLIGVGWLATNAHLTKQGREASDLLYAGVSAANAPVIPEGEEPPEGVTESYSNAKERSEKARDEYRKTIKQFSGSAGARWAQMGEAQALAQLGKNAEAQQAYQRALAGDDQDPFARMLALQGLGFSLEAEKKFGEAATRFEQIGSLAGGAYKPLADYHRARMLRAQGKASEAAKVLEAMIKAERAKPAEQGERWRSVVDDAQTLLDELAVQLDQPNLRSSSGSSSPHGGGLSPEILEALRGQMGAGKGEPGLSEEILKQLEQQVDPGGSQPVPAPAVPAPAPSPPTEGAPK